MSGFTVSRFTRSTAAYVQPAGQRAGQPGCRHAGAAGIGGGKKADCRSRHIRQQHPACTPRSQQSVTLPSRLQAASSLAASVTFCSGRATDLGTSSMLGRTQQQGQTGQTGRQRWRKVHKSAQWHSAPPCPSLQRTHPAATAGFPWLRQQPAQPREQGAQAGGRRRHRRLLQQAAAQQVELVQVPLLYHPLLLRHADRQSDQQGGKRRPQEPAAHWSAGSDGL